MSAALGNNVAATPVAAASGAPAAVGRTDLSRLQAVLDRFEVSIAEANELVVLEDYEMVVIADDSGSMQRAAAPPSMRKLGGANPSRWDELQETLGLIIELASCFDQSGVDVFFLNRQKIPNVKGSSDKRLLDVFTAPPRGGTPLTETLRNVVAQVGGEKPTLLFILTDGEPNGGPRPFIAELRGIVSKQSTRNTFKVQVMACTGEEDEIEWLNVVDRELSAVDVTDDYYSERDQVLKSGLVPKFSRGDWCLKAMLGPVSRKFDSWDERAGLLGHGGAVTQQCDCAIA